MISELLNTPFPEAIWICIKWTAAFLIAGNILNLAWWIASSPFKGIAYLWKSWQEDRALKKRVSTPEGLAAYRREQQIATERFIDEELAAKGIEV